jgi:glycosyltransferase involved in cell wall biosynthesis
MPAEELVSVIVPVLNAERYLRAALDSVNAQTYQHIEMVVVDGGSTDGTLSIVRDYPAARWLPQRGAGLADAWNTGLAAAAGSLIAFQDSDDLWERAKLRLQVDYLAANPQAEYVLGHVRLFVEPGQPRPTTIPTVAFEGPHPGRMPGTLLARRRLFDRVGLFDPSYGVSVDIDWFARLDALGAPGGILPDVVLHKRQHGANYSHTAGPAEIGRHLPRLLKQALDLRRSRPPQEEA